LFEVGVVIAVVMILALIIVPTVGNLSQAHTGAARIHCVNQLKQIGLAYRVWASDNLGKYPMGASVADGGATELVATGNAVQSFLVMSNELSTPYVLHCPMDAVRFQTNSFAGFSSSNLSYFVGVDVTNDVNPQMILSGDDNLEIGGVPVKAGLLALPTNAPVAWTAARHNIVGNIGLADGSVLQATRHGLQQAFQQTGDSTNRLAIP